MAIVILIQLRSMKYHWLLHQVVKNIYASRIGNPKVARYAGTCTNARWAK